MNLGTVATACFGLSCALAFWAGGGYYHAGLEFIERDLRDKLRRLRVNTKNLGKYLTAWIIALAATFLGLSIGLRSPIFGVMFSALMICGPWYLIRRMAERRRLKIEDQLADAMVALSSAIKAGLSLGQSLEILAEQCPRPIREEFQQIVGEYQMGKPLDRCLDEARARLKSENFALFAAAMQASRESGGRLNETVERIAHSVLELQRLERKILSETASARTSAVYMALAPFAVLAVYYFIIDPDNTERLFTTVPGQIMLCASLTLNVVSYVWARAILNSEI